MDDRLRALAIIQRLRALAIIQQYGIAGMADEIVRLRDEIDRLRKIPDDYLAELQARLDAPQSASVWVNRKGLLDPKMDALREVARLTGGTQPEPGETP